MEEETDDQETIASEDDSEYTPPNVRRSRRLRKEKVEFPVKEKQQLFRRKKRPLRVTRKQQKVIAEKNQVKEIVQAHQLLHYDKSLYCLEGITAFLEDRKHVNEDCVFQNSFAVYNPISKRFDTDSLNSILPLSNQIFPFANPSSSKIQKLEDFSWKIREKFDLLQILSSIQAEATTSPFDELEEEENDENDYEDTIRAEKLLGVSNVVSHYLARSRRQAKKAKSLHQPSTHFAWPVVRSAISTSSVGFAALNKLSHHQRSMQSLPPGDTQHLLSHEIRSYVYSGDFSDSPWKWNDVIVPQRKYVDGHYRLPSPTIQRVFHSQFSLFQQHIGVRANAFFQSYNHEQDKSHQSIVSSVKVKFFEHLFPPPLSIATSSTSSNNSPASDVMENESLREQVFNIMKENLILRHVEANIDAILQMIIDSLVPYLQLLQEYPDESVETTHDTRSKKRKRLSLRLNDSLSDDGTYAQRTTPSNGHSIRGMKRIKVEQSKLLTWENILFLFQAIADDLTEKNTSYRQVRDYLPIVLMTPALMERVQERIMRLYQYNC